jgi:serine O-acetyltransferase
MAELDFKTKPFVDPVWAAMREDAATWASEESALASWLHTTVLDQDSLQNALAFLLSQKLGGPEISALSLYQVLHETVNGDAWVIDAARADLSATYERDPACTSYLEPFIFYKGYQALQAHRIAHRLWNLGRETLAYYLQSRTSEIFQVDIHPAAKVGKGIMIDHATAVVIGETAVVGDGVSLLHGVTLGGTGKERGDRHPKIGAGTMIGAGAAILGNIRIGACCRIGAGSVVLKDVPDNTTVAGVPAKEVGEAGCHQPAMAMDQKFW